MAPQPELITFDVNLIVESLERGDHIGPDSKLIGVIVKDYLEREIYYSVEGEGLYWDPTAKKIDFEAKEAASL